MRSLQSFLPVKISSRASLTQPGQSESVWRGHPSVGLVFSQDFNNGLSDHFGVKEGLGWYLLKNWIVSKATLAVLHRSASKIFRTFVAFLLGMAMIPPFRSRWTDDPLTPIRPRLSLEVPADYLSLGAHTHSALTKSLCCQSLPVTPVTVQPYAPKGTKTGVNGTLLQPTATTWGRGLESQGFPISGTKRRAWARAGKQFQSFKTGLRTAMAKCASGEVPSSSWSQRTAQ